MENVWTKIGILFLGFAILSVTAVAQDQDRKAIIEVIEGEHQAFLDRDFERFMSFVDKTETVLWGDGISLSLKGYTEVYNSFKAFIEKNPEPFERDFLKDLNISIAGEKAWVVMERRGKSGNLISKEQRILVKRNDGWKIAVMLAFGV
ncbi:MAG: nuclear transport factor 2 family protein [Saprospiraceae bacterium]|nr:nuclear transport factor 2 family protein [Saprospiraceae bacterium]